MKYAYIIKAVLVTIILVSMIMSSVSIYPYTKLFAYLNLIVAGTFVYVMALKYFEIKQKEE